MRQLLGRRAAAGLLAAALLAAGCVFLAAPGTGTPARLLVVTPASLPTQPPRPAPTGGAGPAAGPATAVEGAERVRSFLGQGWLAGTEVDGDWGLWQGGRLQPSASLRRRFDYLLSGVGEVPVADLRQWIAAEVGARRGADGAAAVLAVFDAYVTLRRDHAEAAFDIDDADSWQRALAERTRQRVAVLGPAWAYAFFADDDREMGAFVQRRLDARVASSAAGRAAADSDPMSLISAPAAPLTAEQAAQREARRVATFGTEAAARMKDVDADWARWQQRLAESRQDLQAIESDPQLSDTQRAQSRKALLAGRFSGTELLRAQALLAVHD